MASPRAPDDDNPDCGRVPRVVTPEHPTESDGSSATGVRRTNEGSTVHSLWQRLPKLQVANLAVNTGRLLAQIADLLQGSG